MRKKRRNTKRAVERRNNVESWAVTKPERGRKPVINLVRKYNPSGMLFGKNGDRIIFTLEGDSEFEHFWAEKMLALK